MDLRHSLATLAYRVSRAVDGAPDDFGAYGETGRTPDRILAHMGDLLDWALSLVQGDQKWNNSDPLPWPAELQRFFSALGALDAALAANQPDPDIARRLFQGPIADALSHAGQIAMLRRLSGSPIPGENYFLADIQAGQVGQDQPAPHRTF